MVRAMKKEFVVPTGYRLDTGDSEGSRGPAAGHFNGRRVRAVVFDAFGTLCEIRDKRKPYSRLAQSYPDRKLARQLLMTRPLSIGAAVLELKATGFDVNRIETDLAAELASIRLYPEVLGVLHELRAKGFMLAIASNLAAPYAEPLLRLLPFEFDAYAWSFEVGYLKPDPRIFADVCDRLHVRPDQALMVGDTFDADYEGSVNAGMLALYLNRDGRHLKAVPSIQTLAELPARLVSTGARERV